MHGLVEVSNRLDEFIEFRQLRASPKLLYPGLVDELFFANRCDRVVVVLDQISQRFFSGPSILNKLRGKIGCENVRADVGC